VLQVDLAQTTASFFPSWEGLSTPPGSAAPSFLPLNLHGVPSLLSLCVAL
jgi:hypothetical protein